MTLINKAKIDLFISSLMIFSSFAFSGAILSSAKTEGSLGNGFTINFLADYLFYLFPGFLIPHSLGIKEPQPYFLALVANIALYSVIASLLLSRKVATLKTYQPFKLTWFAAYFVPTVIVGTMVILAIIN